MSAAQRKILKRLTQFPDGVEAGELLDDFDLTKINGSLLLYNLDRTLDALCARGTVERIEKGDGTLYRITDAGRAVIAEAQSSAAKLTEAQRKVLVVAAGEDVIGAGRNVTRQSGRAVAITLSSSACSALERRGLLSGRIGNDGARWWSITNAGRAALAEVSK